jgi:hypothetical protein
VTTPIFASVVIAVPPFITVQTGTADGQASSDPPKAPRALRAL